MSSTDKTGAPPAELYELGERHRLGQGTIKDARKACWYYRKIVYAGSAVWDDVHYPRACYRLAVAMHYAQGQEQDYFEAMSLLDSAKLSFSEMPADAMGDIDPAEFEREWQAMDRDLLRAGRALGGHLCPVCGKSMFPHENSYEICRVCGWEDDSYQVEFPDDDVGPNQISLNEARELYRSGQTLFLLEDAPDTDGEA